MTSLRNIFSAHFALIISFLMPIAPCLGFTQEAENESLGVLDTTVVEHSTLEPSSPRRQPTLRSVPRPVIVNQTVETATRTEKKVSQVPSTIGVISQDDIARDAPLSFDDLIRKAPNIETFGGPRYLGEQLVIRAQSGNAITVRIDDARQNFVSGHAGQRFFFEPDFLNEIEILKGAGSFLYGSGAGGVVNISTLEPSDIVKEGNSAGLRIRNTYHTNSSEWAHSFIGGITTEKLDVLVGYTDRDANNIELADDVELPDSSIDRDSFLAKVVYRPSNEQKLSVSYFNYESLDFGGANPQANIDSALNPSVERTIDYFQWVGDYEWNPIANDLIDLKATVYYNETTQLRDYQDPIGSSNFGRNNIHDLSTFGLDIRNRSIIDIGNLEHELVYGIEYTYEEQDGVESRNTFFAPGSPGNSSGRPDADADTFAIYLSDEVDITDQLTLFAGIRYDTYSTNSLVGNSAGQDDDSFSPHVGFNLELNEHWSLFGKYSRAFTRPTLNDIYQDGSHFGVVPGDPFFVTVRDPQGGFFPGPIPPDPGLIEINYFEEVFVQNPDLLPETSNNYELGVHYENDDFHGGQLSARLTGFYQRGENTFDTEIVGASTTRGFNGFANPANVPSALTPIHFGPPIGPPAGFAGFTGIEFDGVLTQAYRQTVNRAETEIYGAEFVLDYDADTWFGSFTAGAVRGEDLETGLDLNSTTGDQISLTLGVRPLENLELGAYGIWNGGRESRVNDPFSATSAYDIYGIFGTWQATEFWQIRLGVDNLFDQAYERTNVLQEEPGRNFFISSTLHW